MAKIMKRTAIVAVLMTICSLFLYRFTNIEVLFSITITLGMIAYHFSIRLIIGGLFDKLSPHTRDFSRE